MSVGVECTFCGAKVAAKTVDEAIDWSNRHDEFCSGRRS